MLKITIKSFPFSGDGADLLNLFKDQSYVFLLDSSLGYAASGRYSLLGFDPFKVITTRHGENIFERLRHQWEAFKNYADEDSDLPFHCGCVGYVGYEAGHALERVILRSKPGFDIPESCFGFYDSVLILDHLENKLHVTATGLPEALTDRRREKVNARLQFIERRLAEQKAQPLNPSTKFPGANMLDCLEKDFNQTEYEEMVCRALEYIERGDIYQVNLAQRFVLPSHKQCKQVSSFDLYRTLRSVSPSDFSCYWDCGTHQILSSSPERFVHMRDGRIHSRPMKGTRRRGNDPHEDARLKQELQNSPKEIAELLMITDLLRNDLGRVCEYGSVKVSSMRTIEEYATVFQATSTVEGQLKSGKTALDVLQACFPGGSITGCPKIRAMHIIDELERSCRGIYTGAFGYIDASGAMDFNILIRTLLRTSEGISFHVGGGIVADSIPRQEYEETLIKAKALCESLALFKG